MNPNEDETGATEVELVAVKLGPAVGRSIQAIRNERGWTQEETTDYLRRAGLNWSRAQLAFLESGRRDDLTVSELILLAEALRVPLVRFVEWPALFKLSAERTAPAFVVTGLLSGGEPIVPQDIFLTQRQPGGPATVTARPHRSIPSIAEVRAGRRLGIDPLRVHEMATHLWGHGLDEERERRLGDRAQSGVSRTAYRGHVTRSLVEELGRSIQAPRGRPVQDRRT